MGSAGTDGMTGLFQVSLGEVKVAGEDGSERNAVGHVPVLDQSIYPAGVAVVRRGYGCGCRCRLRCWDWRCCPCCCCCCCCSFCLPDVGLVLTVVRGRRSCGPQGAEGTGSESLLDRLLDVFVLPPMYSAVSSDGRRSQVFRVSLSETMPTFCSFAGYFIFVSFQEIFQPSTYMYTSRPQASPLGSLSRWLWSFRSRTSRGRGVKAWKRGFRESWGWTSWPGSTSNWTFRQVHRGGECPQRRMRGNAQ